ncbi:predicted protein [Postia placenta Mad-698-R]|nr:predicted protein [Postia placenta Mad-698-R]
MLGRQVFAPDTLKDEVARLLLAELHATVHRYIGLAIEHCTEGRVFLLFDIMLHREDVLFDDIDACMQQPPALMYSVLKHCLPAGPARLPDTMARLATSIMRNVICSATHFGIAALAALERPAEDLTRIDLTAYFSLLWSVALGVRPADLIQELLLVLHERRSVGEGMDTDAARRYVYKAALGIVFDRVEEATDACPCHEPGCLRRQRTTPMFARHVLPKATRTLLTHIMVHVRVDAPMLTQIHSYVHLRVAWRRLRSGQA